MAIALDFTTAEKADGRMSPEKLQAACTALRHEGFVVLDDVVDPTHLETLRDRMLQDLAAILAREDAPFNFNAGNVQQDPPPFLPYLFRDVLLNDLVIQITHAMLGPGLKNSFYSGNTALPGERMQPVHPDVAQLWPDLQTASPPFGFVVNIPVVDMTPENGSTELWPGSHNDTTMSDDLGDIKVPEAALERRRTIHPPVQPATRCGGVLIRDIRLWHRGMPNRTLTPRPMIAMIHWIRWWNDNDRIRFPQDTAAFFQHDTLKTNALFVDGPIDYLHHNAAYDFKK